MSRSAITRRSVLAGGVLGLATLAGCSSSRLQGGDGGPIRLDLAHVGDMNSPQQRIAEILREKLNARSDEFDLVIHDSGTLGNETELQGAAVDGTIDLAIAASFSHYAPWAGILETPMLFRSNTDFRDFARGPIGDAVMTDLADELDIVPLFIAPHESPRAITTARTPVRDPEDLHRLKIRNPEVPSYTVMAEAVGAVPVTLDFGELYLALDRGVVDGQHNPLGHVVGQSFYEVQDYLSMVPWGTTPHIVSASSHTWDRLSASHRELIEEVANETSEEYFNVADTEMEERLEFLKDKIEIVPQEDINLKAFEDILSDNISNLAESYDKRSIDILEAIREI